MLAAIVLPAVPASAHGKGLQQSRATARALAAEVAGLDAQIDTAVTAYARATRALDAVRRQIAENRRQQRLARRELEVARATLAARAVAMYKHGDVTALDAVFDADDFNEVVTDLTMVRTLSRSDRDVLRTVEATRRELADREKKLAADEASRDKLVRAREQELGAIRARLAGRRAALAGVRSDVRRLTAAAVAQSPTPATAVEPPQANGGGEGGGPWWALIRSAAASNGVSARGMYRLMMIESGGSATAAGPGGYQGLFQYAPTTWKGGWNPWRSASITDGAAQIKATALALREGYGHAWWDPSYTWAFQGN